MNIQQFFKLFIIFIFYIFDSPILKNYNLSIFIQLNWIKVKKIKYMQNDKLTNLKIKQNRGI